MIRMETINKLVWFFFFFWVGVGGWGEVGLVHKKAQKEIERMNKKWIEEQLK